MPYPAGCAWVDLPDAAGLRLLNRRTAGFRKLRRQAAAADPRPVAEAAAEDMHRETADMRPAAAEDMHREAAGMRPAGVEDKLREAEDMHREAEDTRREAAGMRRRVRKPVRRAAFPSCTHRRPR